MAEQLVCWVLKWQARGYVSVSVAVSEGEDRAEMVEMCPLDNHHYGRHFFQPPAAIARFLLESFIPEATPWLTPRLLAHQAAQAERLAELEALLREIVEIAGDYEFHKTMRVMTAGDSAHTWLSPTHIPLPGPLVERIYAAQGRKLAWDVRGGAAAPGGPR